MLDMISGFMQNEVGGLPVWGWFVLVFGIACVLMAIILVTCLVQRNKNGDGEGESSTTSEETKEEEKEASAKEDKVEEKEEPSAKKSAAAAKKSTASKSEEKTEEKATSEKTSKSTSTKTATAKSSASKTTAKKEDSVKKPETAENSEPKVYHISKRKEDGKWQVKAEGADRALRLFFTQADAITYAKKVAGNQEGRIVVHKESGGFRKLNY